MKYIEGTGTERQKREFLEHLAGFIVRRCAVPMTPYFREQLMGDG